MKPEEVAAYARGVESLLDRKKDPEFALLLIADVVAVGDRARGPASIFAASGGAPGEEVLVPCAGLKTLERAPHKPREPKTSDEHKLRAYALEHAAWCEDERRAGASLALHRKRLTALLSALADYEWLLREHPSFAAALPAATVNALGALLEAFGAGEADVVSSSAIWRYVHAWPTHVRTASRAETPWQDAAGWEE